MCSAARFIALATVALLGAPVGAQSTDRAARQRRSVAIAAETFINARTLQQEREQRRLQTAVVRQYAGLTLRADTSAIPSALLRKLDTAFARARAEAVALFGVTTDSLLAGGVVVLEPRSSQRFRVGRLQSTTESIFADALFPSSSLWTRGFADLDARWSRDAVTTEELEAYFIDWFTTGAALQLSPRVRSWMGTRPPVRAWELDAREAEHRGMVFHPSSIGLACTQGSIGACRSALALAPDGDTIGLWFDAPTRRARAMGALRILTSLRAGPLGVNESIIQRCTEKGDDVACRAVLARARVPSPTSRPSREYIVRAALLRGGEHAFERLRADTAMGIEAAITAAAGVHFDSLIVPWRAEMLASRPPSPAPDVREFLLGALLISATIGAAIGRRPL